VIRGTDQGAIHRAAGELLSLAARIGAQTREDQPRQVLQEP
jgi:hypothetical protein